MGGDFFAKFSGFVGDHNARVAFLTNGVGPKFWNGGAQFSKIFRQARGRPL